MSLIPVVAEQTERGERVSSIFSLLLGGRTIYCEPSVTNESLNLPVVHFLCSDSKGLGKGASLSANRLSEAVSGGLAINDTTQYARSGASTLCWKQGTYTAGWHSFVGSEKRRPMLLSTYTMLYKPIEEIQEKRRSARTKQLERDHFFSSQQ